MTKREIKQQEYRKSIEADRAYARRDRTSERIAKIQECIARGDAESAAFHAANHASYILERHPELEEAA